MTTQPPQRILKANAARDLVSRVSFNFEDLRQQAADQLRQSHEEAAALVDQARKDAEAIRQQALVEGREAGRKEGLKDAADQIAKQANQQLEQRLAGHLKTTLPALVDAAKRLNDERERWLQRWERGAIELSVAIAEKLLRSSLQTQPERAVEMVRAALELAAGQTHLRVQLHPDDIKRLGDHATQVVQSISACGDAELIPDSELSPGGCRIETRFGEIDASLEAMLERISDELLG